MKLWTKAVTSGILVMNLIACSHQSTAPLDTVTNLDLDRFMGGWFVVATIPTPLEKDLYSPHEYYARNADGTIETIFSYRRGSLTAPVQEMRATGFVRDTNTNATWSMQPFWPIKAEYLVLYIQEPSQDALQNALVSPRQEYQYTIIGRNKRDYLWIMARQARVQPDQLAELIDRAVAFGYPRAAIQLPIHD
jgi:apolipoprotein D and lipocalin family protein